MKESFGNVYNYGPGVRGTKAQRPVRSNWIQADSSRTIIMTSLKTHALRLVSRSEFILERICKKRKHTIKYFLIGLI